VGRKRIEYIKMMSTRCKTKPEDLRPPKTGVLIEGAAVLAFLKSEGIMPVKQARERVERLVIELGGDPILKKNVPERTVAPAGRKDKGEWRLYVAEMNSSEEATIIALFMADGISNAMTQVGAQWEGRAIGEFSIGHPREKRESWNTTVFRRGNVAVVVRGGSHREGQPWVDARKLASLVDRYLTKRPDEGLKAEKRAALKKIEMVVREATGGGQGPAQHVVEGKPYGLSVEGIPEAVKGKGLRICVDRGEVVRQEDGTLRVTFEGKGSHEIHAYAMDADGKCVALGEKEVLVEAADK
jgi:hypothetical protein